MRHPFPEKPHTNAITRARRDINAWWRGQPDSWKGHIGIVHHSSDGIVYTIEGNKSGFPTLVRVFNYVIGRIDRLLEFGRVPV